VSWQNILNAGVPGLTVAATPDEKPDEEPDKESDEPKGNADE
jgi:hypothetical protein